MNFGKAIEEMKSGKKVARQGWNGKNQYIELATNISYKNAGGDIVNCEHDAIGNKAIAFVGTSGVQMGWLASQADMLAEDWQIVQEQEEDMLKAAIEKILSLDAPHIEEIEGRTYVDKDMTQIGKELRATGITMSNLSSLVDFIKKSKADFKTGHYIAQVVSPTEVRLFSSLDADRQRETLAVVKAEIPEFSFGQFIGNEEFVIGVQSKFLNEDAEANDKPIILQFAGNVKAGTVAEYGDTCVGQKAAIKKGVASLQEVEVPSPCRLMPYRTFTEVAQPMSNFIFRVKDNDRYGVTCALFEADGGAWKNEAKANIKAYLEKELADVSNIFVIS